MAELNTDQESVVRDFLRRERFGELSEEDAAMLVDRRARGAFPPPLDPVPQGAQDIYGTALGHLGFEPSARNKQRIQSVGDFLSSPAAGRMAVETGGEVLGALAAPAAAPARAVARPAARAIGTLATRMGLAGVGGGAGSLASESFDPTNHPYTNAAITALTGVAGEGAASALGKGAGMIFGQKGMRPGGREAAEQIFEGGGVPRAGDLSNSRFIQALDHIAEQSILGGKRVATKQDEAIDIAQRDVTQFVDEFAGVANREDIGTLILDALDKGLDSWRAQTRRMFSGVDELLAAGMNFGVNMTPVREVAEQIIREAGAGLGDPTTVRLAENILSKGGLTSFSDAAILRSDLLAVGRTGTDLVKGQAQRSAGTLARALDDAMTKAAKTLNPDALAAWRAANKLYKDGAKTWGDRLVKSLFNKDPDMIFQAVVKPNRPVAIKRLRAVLDRNQWKAVQGHFFLDLLRKPTDDLTEQISGAAIIKRLSVYGDETLEALFPKGGLDEFRQLATTLALVRGTKREGSMTLLQSGQMLAVLQLVFGVGPGGVSAASVSLLLGPLAIARLMTNKKAVKAMTLGLASPPGSQAALRAATQLLAASAERNLLPEDVENQLRAALGEAKRPPAVPTTE